MRSWVRRGLYDILFGLLTVSGCQKTAPGPVAGATVSGSASSAGTAAAADGGADVRRASASYHDVGVRTHDGTTWVWGERVDADVVHAKRVAALFVEANEIRCPRVIRSKSASVPKDINPWLIDGDVVEVDELWAHSVSARIIIADQIDAIVVKHLGKPHRWAGAGGATPVHNRVTVMKDLVPSDEVPVF